MKNNLTELIFVLDRSGSMEHLASETIGGFNSLIEKQKKETEGEVYVTTVLFDDKYELLHDHMNIHDIPRLTDKDYYARGCTALLDAVGRTIDRVGERLSKTAEDQRPSQILFVITTDGYENASVDYTKSKVKDMITLQQNTYSWKFLFLGADIDAVSEADSLGIRHSGVCRSSASVDGIKTSYQAVSHIADYLRKSPSSSSKSKASEDAFASECAVAFSRVK